MKLIRYFLFLLFLALLIGPASANGRYRSISSKPNDHIEVVDFCALLSNPAKYRGKTVRLRVILVENNRPRIDGAEPLIYDPGCRNSKLRV